MMDNHAFKQAFRDVLNELIVYLKHPVSEIRRLPEWSWPRLLSIHVGVVVAVSLLSSLVALFSSLGAGFSFFGLIFGTIAKAVITLIITLITALYFFYTLQIAASKVVSFRKLFLTVFFSFLPFFLFQIFHDFFPPIDLIGFAFTAVLLVVGVSDNLQVPKSLTIRLVAGITLIFILIWLNGRRSSDVGQFSRKSQIEAPEVHLGDPSN